MPSCWKVRATEPSGRTTLVAVKKIRMARGMTIIAMARNWRARNACGPFLDGQRDLLHFGGALVEGEDVARQEQAGDDADDAGDQADVQPRLVDSTQVEGLVAAFGCEHSDHSRCALSVPVRLAGRGWRRPPPCGAAALSTIAFDVITPGRRRAGEVAPDAGPGGR